VITRPLDLADRLRRTPRSFDAFFYVNVGVLALGFTVFGSRFVLAPGLPLEFALPQVASAATRLQPVDIVVAVPSAEVAIVSGRVVDFAGLRAWLLRRGQEQPGTRLLVQASATLPASAMAEIQSYAAEARLGGVLLAVEAARPAE
jgi:biopolymer transport protein ExbD